MEVKDRLSIIFISKKNNSNLLRNLFENRMKIMPVQVKSSTEKPKKMNSR